MKNKVLIESFEDFKTINNFEEHNRRLLESKNLSYVVDLGRFVISRHMKGIFSFQLTITPLDGGQDVSINYALNTLEEMFKVIYETTIGKDEKVQSLIKSSGWYRIVGSPEISEKVTNGRNAIVAFNPVLLEVVKVDKHQDLLFSAFDYMPEMPENIVLDTYDRLISMGYEDTSVHNVRLNGFYI